MQVVNTPEVSLSGTNGDVTVRGYIMSYTDVGSVDVFLGLPYALPPTGDRRFAPSIPLSQVVIENGPSIYEGTLRKPRCLQTISGGRGGFADEDCLYLDIWRTTGTTSTGKTEFSL